MVTLVSSDVTADHVQLTLEKEKQQCKTLCQKFTITDETPHTQWLYDYVCNTLDKSYYVVKSQVANLKYLGDEDIQPCNITDYACSKADLVIRWNVPIKNQVSLQYWKT